MLCFGEKKAEGKKNRSELTTWKSSAEPAVTRFVVIISAQRVINAINKESIMYLFHIGYTHIHSQHYANML